MDYISDKDVKNLAQKLINYNKNIILIFAFNGTGKTRLSIEYKNVTKEKNDGSHSGVYYNAYSEDLFVWNNDAENIGESIKLKVMKSNLNQYHSSIDEKNLEKSFQPINQNLILNLTIIVIVKLNQLAFILWQKKKVSLIQ